jgi:erythritol transport system ATP-binding protein
MSRLALEGFGIVFVSSELKEVLAMSDRILVLSKGEVVAEFAGDRATETELVDASAVGHGPAVSTRENGRAIVEESK